MAIYETYTVRRGDSLGAIARRNGLTIDALSRLNAIADPDKIGVGQVLRIRKISESFDAGDPAPTVVATISDPAGNPITAPPPPHPPRHLGNLSRRYEVSSGGPGTVSHGRGDRGGVSYGTYQLASKLNRPREFLAQEGQGWAAEFAGAEQGGERFTTVWKRIAARDPEAFGQAQHAYIKRTHYDVQIAHVRGRAGMDLSTRSHALQDVIWSTAVQHGPSGNVVVEALKKVGVAPSDGGFDKELIMAIYAERGRRRADGALAHFSRNSKPVQDGVAARFRHELKDALEMLAAEVTRRALVPVAAAAATIAGGTAATAEADADALIDKAAQALSDDEVRLLIDNYGDDEALNDFLAGRRVAIALRKSTNWRLHPKGKYDDLIIVAWREPGGTVRLKRFMGNTEPAGEYAHGAAKAAKGSSTDLDGDGRKDLGRLVPGTYHYELQPGSFLGAQYWRARNVQEAVRDLNHDGLFIVGTGADIIDKAGAGRSMLIHQGGDGGTWSAGCQTIPKSRFGEFMGTLGGQKTLSYILIDAD